MKHRIMIAMFCVVCFVLVMLSACSENTNEPTTTPTTEPTQPSEPTEPTAPPPVTATEFLNQIEITSLTDDTFSEILESAATFLDENPLISVPINTYTLSYTQESIAPENYILSEETDNIVLNATQYGDEAEDIQKVQYLLMVYCLSEKYADCIMLRKDGYIHSAWVDHDMMCIYPSFPESEFSDILEYRVAIMKGEIPIPEDAYEVYFCYHGVRKLTDRKNLLIFFQG